MADDTDSAAAVLAPPTTPTGVMDSPVPPSLAPTGIPLMTPQNQPVDPGSGDQTTDTIPTQTTPAYQDPEMVMGAAHHNWLANLMHGAASLLGGDETWHVTRDKDGNISATSTPSTEGEKWGRVAASILGGAAKGYAAGQGPGGAARAVNAGMDFGMQARNAQKESVNQDVDTQQQQMTRNANNALLNHKVIRDAWDNDHLSRDDMQKQAEYALDMAGKAQSMGLIPLAMGVKDPKTLAKYGNVNPEAVGAHMGANGEMVYNLPDGHGGVDFYRVPAQSAKALTREDDPWDDPQLDPKDPTKVTYTHHNTTAGSETYGDRFTRQMALSNKKSSIIKEAFGNQMTQEERQTAQDKETREKALQPYTIAHTQAETSAANAEADIRKQNLQILKGGTGAGAGEAAAGLHGDDYLKASGIDPAAWNRIKATANGDLKPPTTSRSPANAAFLNAVQNYDPTYTQARYDTKQNFKTKGDATSVMQLSTALAHAESALRNSATLGNSPSLATGVNLSGPAAAYNSDANFFTGEQGKLVMGGIVGEKEGERIRDQITSPIQSIRDSGLREVLRLTGGKVGAMFQKYKTGAQQDLPVQEFFDQPTQRLLSRYGVTKQQPQTPPQPPNVSQAARAPGGPAQATAPHAPAQRDNTGTITLPAGATGGYKNGQLVGYQDANGWHQ